LWKIAQNRLLVLVYNNSIFHTFETKNVENVESHDYQRLFKIENVEEMWKKKNGMGYNNKYDDRERILG